MIPRFFSPDPEWRNRRKDDSKEQLIQSLTRLVTNHPPDRLRPTGGLFYGPLSVSYLLLRLHPWYPELVIEGQSLRAWAERYRQRTRKYLARRAGPTVEKCGVIDDGLVSLALDATFDRDLSAVERLCTWANMIAASKQAGNEWLYGRAGLLYLLRLVRRYTSTFSGELQSKVKNSAENVISSILQAERPWTWHGKNYVGAVHGTIGIITQIVLTDPSKAPELAPVLASVLNEQLGASGNFPSSLPAGRYDLVQFCHGAPGVVASLQSIRTLFDPSLQDRIDLAIKKGQRCIVESGLLTKEPCLCHGISGNALAITNQVNFECFLHHTTASAVNRMRKGGLLDPSDSPEGLYTGEAGRAWAWAVADRQAEKTFLGYNDIQ